MPRPDSPALGLILTHSMLVDAGDEGRVKEGTSTSVWAFSCWRQTGDVRGWFTEEGGEERIKGVCVYVCVCVCVCVCVRERERERERERSNVAKTVRDEEAVR